MAGSSWTNQIQNTVIVAGTRPGVYVYNGNPGLGNIPIAWMSNSTVDPFGNVLPSPGGVGAYDGTAAWSQLDNGLVLLGSTAVYTPARMQLDSVTGGLEIWSPQLNSGDTRAEIELFPSSSGLPYAVLSGYLQLSKITPPAAAGTALWTNANGTPSLQTAAGFAGQIPADQVDTAQHINNGSTATAVAITTTYTIPAGDMKAGTVYMIEVPYNGVQESETVTWGISLDGGSPVAQDGIAASFFANGTAFVGTVRGKLQILTTGATGSIIYHLDGGVGQSGVRTGGGGNNDAYLSAVGTGGTLNTTVSHTLAVTAQFGAIAAGETITGYGSVFTRKGP